MANYDRTLILNSAGIDEISEQLSTFMEESETDPATILRIRLSIEEALLRFYDHFPDDQTVHVFIGRRFTENEIHIELKGHACNPLVLSDNAIDNWNVSLLSDIGISPHYSYAGSKNHLRLILPRKHMNPVLKLMICVILGLFFGLTGHALIGKTVVDAVINTVLDPFFDLWMRVLNLLCGPLIFILVLHTVLSLHTVDVQGGNKKRVILRYISLLIILGIAVIVVVRPFLPLEYTSGKIGTNEFSEILDTLFGIMAEDMISPFVTVNTAQLVLMAVFIGSAINRLHFESDVTEEFIDECYGIGLQLADWVSSAVPFFSVILMTLIIWRGDIAIFQNVWIAFLLFIALSILTLLIWMFYLASRHKIPLTLIWSKLKQSFMVTLRTGSINEAYSYIEKSVISSFGMERHFAKASLPSGLVLFMPSSLIELIVFSIYAAKIYNVPATLSWYFMLLFLTVVLSMASPPVAGVSLISFMTIFAQLGIPRPALIAGMIADIIFGVIAGAFNQAMLQCELVLQAGEIGLINSKVISSDK